MPIRLSNIRLVNWHIFRDACIPVGDTTLFAGDNGSGKSTIIDAIQYALVADLKHIKFNSAASDRKTGRTLESYCRGKIGAEELEFIRGDCTTHVILEFGDGKQTFIAGILIESFGDGSRSNETPWMCDALSAAEVAVAVDDVPVSPRDFRDYIKARGGNIFSTKRRYNDELSLRLGVFRKNTEFNPYLEALVRAVSFTPLNSVDQFICNYILEDKPLDISEMKLNLENYRAAEKEAKGVQERIDKLVTLEKIVSEIAQEERRIRLQNYLKLRIETEIAEQRVADNESALRTSEAAVNRLMREMASLEEERARCGAAITDSMVALARNDAYVLIKSLDEKIESCEREIAAHLKRRERRQLLLSQASSMLGQEIGSDIGNEILRIERERDTAVAGRNQLKQHREEAEKLLADYSLELDELSKGMTRFPDSTDTLKKALEKSGIAAYVFADILEITDQSWQNAIEGWLNTQRFSVLVSDSDYPRALEIYNALPRAVAGVGLPDLVKMKSSRPKKGSLFSVLEPKSPFAEIYASYLLGEVMMAELGTLRDYPKSVTKDCMRYSSFTAARIKEDVYSRWYIGRAAREQRMVFLSKEIDRLRKLTDEYSRSIDMLEKQGDLLRRVISSLYEIREIADVEDELRQKNEELVRFRNEKNAIDMSSLKSLQDSIDTLRAQSAALDEQIKRCAGDQGKYTSKVAECTEKTAVLTGDYEARKAVFDDYTATIDAIAEFRAYYDERTGQADKDDILRNFESAIKGSMTKRDKLVRELSEKTILYNRDHNESLSGSTEHPEEIPLLLKKYRDTELPSYLERITSARKNAESQFMGDFVSRLSEHLVNARETVRQLNHTLKEISFGRDRYRFHIEEKQEKKNQIAVIRKASEISGNRNTLFESLTTVEEKRVVDDLFRIILEKDLTSPEVASICDYRKYFQYDIKMIDTTLTTAADGREMELSLSRVIREKSGGEAQTPYYVAIAAGFMRFFSGNANTIRLALFDEAFNKMDDSRIENTIGFFKKIGIQVITAVPTEKIETIAPFMDATNLVIRHGTAAVVREYRYNADAELQ